MQLNHDLKNNKNTNPNKHLVIKSRLFNQIGYIMIDKIVLPLNTKNKPINS